MSTQPYVGPPLSRRRSRRDSERDSDIRYPEYKLPFNRLKSFDSWPRGIKQRPQELVEAGFFYSGKGDEIVCFSCALGICQLEPDDNPWVEHKKLLINPCSYLDLNRDLLRTNEIKHEELLTQRMLVLEAKQTDQTKQWYDLENEATSSNNDTQCKICLDRQANIVLLPCKHVVTCSQCVFGLNDKCPVCRGNIVEKISLYYS